ncbi:cupin domain-containing protein [Saccharopolyspora sp. NPDC047091]|uniref:(R)-mandelonitrile lyase n=1 Tax=Saccharopolyspora sp. NPDC047091 TaxID=3155924 RepID=UPI0033D127A8
MEFTGPRATTRAPAEWFTGDVWFDVLHVGTEPSRLRANLTRFAPGARTRWHHHAVGQTLHVVAGTALIGTRDGTIFEAQPGETVHCPPGEEHWHGAAPDRFMEHLALWEAPDDDRPETSWLEPVTAEQYEGPRTRRG